ncbi:MAG: FAD-binding and (Fe-S)-binding domain-containing protein [Chitinophagaceae bacterium]|nr:FAD-binding and (Fe-S)-binding domain-containing protein [Chitinophagaceae bacterium]
MDWLKSLQSFLPPERIKTKRVDVVAYAADAGFYYLIPKAVVQPVSEEEIKKLFAVSQQFNVPLVFRAGGTSLSGQSITDGILVDIGKHWRKAEPLDNAKLVRVQPGITGGMVNVYLKKYGKKIGPDPSSINAAMMGGILSNNSSGMCCGVVYNSYHTLKAIRFVLPDQSGYDTAVASDYDRFLLEQKLLCSRLTELRTKIFANEALLEKIRRKYKIKNTVGYGLNAFVDYEHPLDILSHLLIGAEGTLGFIAEAVMQTLPDLPCKAASMLYFRNIYEACSAIVPLRESGAEALELMDRASLRSVENIKGLPDFFKTLPEECAALLCEYQTETKEELQQKLAKSQQLLQQLSLLHPADFTTDDDIRNFYWKIRKGMIPSIGAVRQKGTTVMLEDIAFPVEHLADAVIDMQQLFKTHHYDDAIIFGHAKDGNLHFVITQLLDDDKEVQRYDAFIKALVEMVVKKYDGALKAEHGTGRNMAPFVEAEWGGDAYAIMKEIKQVIDPKNLLNPGVIINEDKDAHIHNLKTMPQVEEEVDKCIECGFCESHCPSRDITLTPRQRIQVRRQLKRYEKERSLVAYYELLAEYQYSGLDTCATDGLCQSECPVQINTGELVKRLRREQHGSFSNKMALFIAKRFAVAEGAVKGMIRAGKFMNVVFGRSFMFRLTTLIRRMIPSMPLWWNEIPAPPRKISNVSSQPQAVYFSSCIHRMMGNGKEKSSIQQTFLNVCKKAGIEMLLPDDIKGYCCGQPFSSKGYLKAGNYIEEKTIDALLNWSQNGKLPVICDFTSCTHTFLHNQTHLRPEYQKKFKQLKLMDSIVFLQEHVMPGLTVSKKKNNIVLHPSCAAVKLNLVNKMNEVAKACAAVVNTPKYSGCCGMAGDRGFLFPELTQSATAPELAEALSINADGYYSTAKTCEMALTHTGGKNYEHLIYLLDEVSEEQRADFSKPE